MSFLYFYHFHNFNFVKHFNEVYYNCDINITILLLFISCNHIRIFMVLIDLKNINTPNKDFHQSFMKCFLFLVSELFYVIIGGACHCNSSYKEYFQSEGCEYTQMIPCDVEAVEVTADNMKPRSQETSVEEETKTSQLNINLITTDSS